MAFPKTGTQIRHEFSTSVLLFFGDGHGHLSTGPVLTVGAEPHTVIAVDVNHDGHLDLAVTGRTSGTVTVLLGDGRGNFSSTTSVFHDTMKSAMLDRLSDSCYSSSLDYVVLAGVADFSRWRGPNPTGRACWHVNA